MNSKYTGEEVEYLLDKISSGSGTGGGGGPDIEVLKRLFLRKDADDRSPYTIASDKSIEVGEFVSGVSGAVIYVDEQTGKTVGELDKLYVRMKAYFEQLEIINVNSVGGKLIISPAGGIKCNKVETSEDVDYYRCYFLAELDGEKIENRFSIGDQAYSKTFNAKEGVTNNISNRYYWRLVVGVGEDYIDLSKTDCDTDSDIPEAGDVIVQRGNREDIDRLNIIEFSSVDSFSPSITLYQGINDYSLLLKEVVLFGVEKTTGKAFMNVYGDMYVGNRDKSSYITYSPEKGVEIKGTLALGTKLGDNPLLELIDKAGQEYKEDLDKLKGLIDSNLDELLKLIDGTIETWFYDPEPSLTNVPASQWTTNEIKNLHLGDLYYSGYGRAYRFQYNESTSEYYWNEIVDTDIVKALENAAKAQDTADGKRRIFARLPTNADAYDIGDMWVNATYSDSNVSYSNDLLRCNHSKIANELWSINHWELASKYTDDTVAKEALKQVLEAKASIEELKTDVSNYKDYIDGAFSDGIIEESEAIAIEKWSKLIISLREQARNSYEEIVNNSLLEGTTVKTVLDNAYSVLSTAITELLNAINTAIADGKTTSAEKSNVDYKYDNFNSKYGEYNKALNSAIRYIEETLNDSISVYLPLKDAFLQDTTITGGLIQSTSLILGYKDGSGNYNIMAGTNGLLTGKGQLTPAFWMGGDMIDKFDYYNPVTKTFNVPEGVRPAMGMDRMDGTGYRAGGNLWWDNDGKLYADPLSFFVGEATVGALLASFLVVLKSDGKSPEYIIPQVPFLSLTISSYLRIGGALLKYDDKNKAVYVTHPDGSTDTISFYAEGSVSAKGISSSSGGGGGGTGGVSALYLLVDVLPNSNNDGVLDAVRGSVLTYNGTKWQAGSVITDISTLTLSVNGTLLFAFDGKEDVTANITIPTKLSQLANDIGVSSDTVSIPLSVASNTTRINSIEAFLQAPTFNELTANILNSVEELNVLGLIISPSRILTWDTPSFASITDKPTTVAGYGITDGMRAFGVTGTDLNTLKTNGTYYVADAAINRPSGPYFQLLCMRNGDTSAQLAIRHIIGGMYYRGASDSGGWYSWKTVLDSFNYNSYVPTLTGTGASGIWGINITGNADSSTKLQTARTIWGQSFDGTGNVSGALSDVTDITTSGNITIGNTLEVKGITKINNSLQLYNNIISDVNTDSPKLWLTSIKDLARITGSYIQALSDGPYGRHTISFFTKNADNYTTEPFERLRICSNGNVGIGITSPIYKLDVNGTAHINSSSYFGNTGSCDITCLRNGTNYIHAGTSLSTGGAFAFTVNGGGANTIAMTINADRSVTTYSKLISKDTIYSGGSMQISRHGNGSESIEYMKISVADVSTTFNAYDSDGYSNMFFQSNGTTYVTFSGNNKSVGIGVIDPVYKLHVEGQTYSSSGFIKGSSSDSYVLLGGGGHKLLTDFFTALSSEQSTPLSITVGNTTKIIPYLYATYLGGNPASYFASYSSLSSLTDNVTTDERIIAEKLASIEAKLASIEAWISDPNIRELTDFRRLFNELFDVVYSGGNVTTLYSRHDFASYGAITARSTN